MLLWLIAEAAEVGGAAGWARLLLDLGAVVVLGYFMIRTLPEIMRELMRERKARDEMLERIVVHCERIVAEVRAGKPGGTP